MCILCDFRQYMGVLLKTENPKLEQERELPDGMSTKMPNYRPKQEPNDIIFEVCSVVVQCLPPYYIQ